MGPDGAPKICFQEWRFYIDTAKSTINPFRSFAHQYDSTNEIEQQHITVKDLEQLHKTKQNPRYPMGFTSDQN